MVSSSTCPSCAVSDLNKRLWQTLSALEKINAIRNSIIGAQSMNWSEHAYPLVAALNEVGFEGDHYHVARANLGTLIERAERAEARVTELEELLTTACRELGFGGDVEAWRRHMGLPPTHPISGGSNG